MSEKQEKYRMKYSIGSNFDPNLIHEIARIDEHNAIATVFAKLRSDIVGGGRQSSILPNISLNQVKKYVELCHDNKIQFNYLLNPMCLGNKDLEASAHKKLLRYIDQLANIGVDYVTVNSPYLCELIKKRFPTLKISIGIYAGIFNIQHIKYWEEFGADELTLQHSVNRNFNLLEKMLMYTKKSNISLRLIANNICIHECPYQTSHGTGIAHASQKGQSTKKLYLDYYLAKCTYSKVSKLENFIASDWIRPEDVKYYEELCEKTGNYNFSIKLVDRTRTTDFLTRVAKAYINQEYNGNLLDITAWQNIKEIANVHIFESVLESFTGRYNMKEVAKFDELFKVPSIYIDNKKLDGFINKFTNNYECDSTVCGAIGCSNSKDNESVDGTVVCNYCKQWADKVININEDDSTVWKQNTEKILDSFKTSSIFGVKL
ncbi:peptidase U32-like protein [Ruminiclostridium sufflavum DSM 19573]|uniref:Peptidase U32-like protein n=1 Tax=Ruminiclostridium sufflavum DSM 19573 TaxID=1121337 RepID=A0A318XJF7_9FIRM|nr:U32 family peptidase [Ruminiclostridium sufflavum]PYG86588.1 peptidase U32-like protein [Ruminiclostridium sufflavum DSM 19573]